MSAGSLKSTKVKPGVKGPKFVYQTGSSHAPEAVMLLPQKHPFARRIVALSLSTSLTVYPHLHASLTAVSAASHPVFIGRTLS